VKLLEDFVMTKTAKEHGFKLKKGQSPAFQTNSGTLVYLTDPKKEQICIYDIAHNLSHQARYNGALDQFYSVAQHSVYVAEYMESQGHDTNMCLKALLHDAHEAYLGDVVTPLKVLLPDYMVIEQNLDDVICDKFKVPRGMPPELKEADKIIYATEVRDLRKPYGAIKYPGSPSLKKPLKDVIIKPVDSKESLRLFLQKYLEYTNQ
jgi:hypothetical protein